MSKLSEVKIEEIKLAEVRLANTEEPQTTEHILQKQRIKQYKYLVVQEENYPVWFPDDKYELGKELANDTWCSIDTKYPNWEIKHFNANLILPMMNKT